MPAEIATAPNVAGKVDVFLAGGIRGTDAWQSMAAQALADAGLRVANPRRPQMFNDPGLEPEQIRWEADHLSRSRLVMFWFPGPGDHPIAMYELGRWAAAGKRIVVGCPRAYARRVNIVTQLELVRPEVEVHTTLLDTLSAVLKEAP